MRRVISISQNESKISFNNLIYFPEVLDCAVNDFKKKIDIELIKEGLVSHVIIKSSEELKEITYEFCNYSLALMKDAFVKSAHYTKTIKNA